LSFEKQSFIQFDVYGRGTAKVMRLVARNSFTDEAERTGALWSDLRYFVYEGSWRVVDVDNLCPILGKKMRLSQSV
jgi:hypothetical protein